MIIDVHTHFANPLQPKPLLFRSASLETYKEIAVPNKVTGTVVTESIADIEDNQWTLDLADRDPFIVGLIGFLDPFSVYFDRDLERFAADPRFCGIRLHHNCCHVYAGNCEQTLDNISPRLVASLKRLAGKGLTLDVHGSWEIFEYFLALNRRVDGLRIIINHIGECRYLDGYSPNIGWTKAIRKVAQCANIYCKVSALVQMTVDTPAPADLEIYRPALDVLWDAFGADRLLYGSNWPQIERVSDFDTAHALVAQYFGEKGSVVEENFFGKNAQRIYKFNRL